MKTRDQLEKQSLLMISAAMFGNVGNYAYHVITGRLLSETEYGLLMALFGIINLFLIPMSALSLTLTRAVSVQIRDHQGAGISRLFRNWSLGMGLAVLMLLLLAWGFATPLQQALGFNRLAPILLMAFISGFNLLITLSGSLLQGQQKFKSLAMRGSLQFMLRALLVGFCLWLGWRAAGWALLAHVLAMIVSLVFSLFCLLPGLSFSDSSPAPPARPILRKTLGAMPIMLALSTLMTADVILSRRYFGHNLSGQFAQAATLGRMILWLPLPIAQVMFPKVVRNAAADAAQKRTLLKALGYTLLLVLFAFAAGWIGAPLALRWVYGITNPPPAQIAWLRGTAGAMALLGPVYLLTQYELARGKIRKLLPLCFLAPLFPILVHFFHQSPSDLILILTGLNAAALICVLTVLRKEV